MDEKKNFESENQNYLSGFDSAFQTTPKSKEPTFNPTPMFSGMKGEKSGYTVTPQGSFYNNTQKSDDENVAKEAENSAEIKETPYPVQGQEPATSPVILTPETEAKDASVTPVQNTEPYVSSPKSDNTVADDQPKKTETPDFIPSGTYSYSAAKGNLKSSAFETPDVSTPKNETEYTPPVYTPPTQPINPVNPGNSKPSKPKREKKPKKYGAGVIIVAALLAAVIGAGGGIFGVFFAQKGLGLNLSSDTAENSSNSTVSDTPQNVTNITVDETVNSSIEAVAKKAGPSIIGIRTTAAVTNFFGGSSESTGEGSGIIYTADGYIITNYHVIESAVESSNSKIEVFLADNTETGIEATVIGYNIASDLAVVKVDKKDLPAIDFADSDKLSVGQYAIAIGNPGGLEFIGSVSSGIISGLNRSVTVGTGNTMSLIQTDAAINPGNSGGALVDINGKLIGVNSVKLVSTGYEGMGFAIPSNTVKEICDNIIAKQNDPTPYIGIEISQSYTAEQLQALGYPAGAVVVSVVEGGPADESKIQRGDIITEFNGVTISSYAELDNAISQCKPGDAVTVKLFRAGRFYSTHINVAANNAQ